MYKTQAGAQIELTPELKQAWKELEHLALYDKSKASKDFIDKDFNLSKHNCTAARRQPELRDEVLGRMVSKAMDANIYDAMSRFNAAGIGTPWKAGEELKVTTKEGYQRKLWLRFQEHTQQEYQNAKKAEDLKLLEQQYQNELANSTATRQAQNPYLKLATDTSRDITDVWRNIRDEEVELTSILLVAGVIAVRIITSLCRMLKGKPYIIIPHVIAALLLLASLDMPYGYYIFLSLAVSAYAGSLFLAHLGKKESPHRELKLILAASLCILYQPLIKVPLERDIWQWINLATVGVMYIIQPRRDSRDQTNPPL